jgi:hypothetical protein
MARLLDEPRWAPAAQALVDGCSDLHDDEDRVALLATVCDALGDELYPAFLRVLWIIGRQGDHGACAAVARALVHALRTGRLPSGRRGAWGDSSVAAASAAYGQVRCLGPLEYLCAWHVQSDAARALSPAQFHTAARGVMELVDASSDARMLYCDKLLADADDPLPGALTRQSRVALRALASAWASGVPPFEACARFLQALPAGLHRPEAGHFGWPPLLSRGGQHEA